MLAGFSIPPQKADSEAISSSFWKKITFSIDFYLYKSWKEFSQKLGKMEEINILNLKKNSFTIKNIFTKGNYKEYFFLAEGKDPRSKKKNVQLHISSVVVQSPSRVQRVFAVDCSCSSDSPWPYLWSSHSCTSQVYIQTSINFRQLQPGSTVSFSTYPRNSHTYST